MKIQMMLVVVLMTMFAAMESMRRSVAAEDSRPPVSVDPSRGTSPINPSGTITPIVPSQSIEPIAPSRAISPIAPSRTGDAPPNADPDGGTVTATPSATPLTARVFAAISAGPNSLEGGPAIGDPGIPVKGLRVETDRGSIVLRGVVGSEREKSEAGERATEIAGRVKVINKLIVTPPR